MRAPSSQVVSRATPFLASLIFHLLVLALLMVSISWRSAAPRVQRAPMEVSLLTGDGVGSATPRIAAAKPVSKTAPSDATSARVSAEPPPSMAVGPRAESGGSAPGGMVWTPPAPTPNAADAAMDAVQAADHRVVLPEVVMGKGASDPVLLSYDEGRWSDASSVAALRGVGLNGRITMAVKVDDRGAVSDCSVTVSSGSAVLDARACDLVRSYSYRPAQDAAGTPHPAIVDEVLEWSADGMGSSPRPTGGAADAGTGRLPIVGMPSRP